VGVALGGQRGVLVTARVLVVGGGPAGLAAATMLARRGVCVTLAEAGAWPRPKMCGEFLSPDAERALAEIGAGGVVRSLGAPAIDAVRVTVARRGRVLAEMGRRLDAAGHGVSRIDLDAALAAIARSAGVDLRERCRIDRLACDASGVRATTAAGEIAADAVVVASGRVPGVGRDATGASREWIAVKTHVRGVRLPRVTELHFVGGAYVGLNEVACRGDRVVNVCALASRRTWEAAGATPGSLWALLARESPAFAERWRQADPVAESFVAAAGFGFAVRGARGRGERPALFVGDAAALIAPLCGDGQAMALAGGAALGRNLADAGNLADPAAVRAAGSVWEHQFRASFRGRLLLGRALQTVLLRPTAAAGLVRTAAAMRPLTAWLYRGTRGPVGPRPI
jgi:2-polyprenyl-6-methoxyphenol hydroxylase-like FAD-dependent oxidoreductase